MKKLKSAVKKLVNLTPKTKAMAVKIYRLISRRRYEKYRRHAHISDRTVVFEAFLGKQYACSPKALFLAMVRDSKYSDYEKIWMFENPEKYKSLEKYPNTKVVKYKSPDYYKSYARAKYWVTNYHLPEGITKSPGQVYIQTWHGTPLKKIGCDVPLNQLVSEDKKRAYKEYENEGAVIDYMPSPSQFYTDTITSAFHLKEQARVLELGYPRNDALFTASKEKCEKIREKLKLPKGKRVILYAPTWRDDQHTAGTGYTYTLGIDFDRLMENLGEEYLILFRAHYLISNSFDFKKYGGVIRNVSEYDDINDLYLVSDLLVTDYSSVFFDYANLRRPMLFYMYDYEKYKNQLRDFYFDISILPGPVIKEETDISGEIKKLLDTFAFDEKYREFNRKFNPFSGPCSRLILEEILK